MTVNEERRALEEERRILQKDKETFERHMDLENRRLEQQQKLFEMKFKMLEEELKKLASEKKKVEKQKEFYYRVKEHEEEAYSTGGSFNVVKGEMFFSGVGSKQSLRKRYKDLIKIYHPDNVNGDNNTIQEINREYDQLSKVFG